MISKMPTILVVDDEQDIREGVSEMLRDTGLSVLEASSGAEAIAISDGFAGEIDLLLTDLIMPAMTGRMLADTLCAHRPGLQVIFMSAYVEEERGEAREPGLHYIQKPFPMRRITQMVSDLLASKKPK